MKYKKMASVFLLALVLCIVCCPAYAQEAEGARRLDLTGILQAVITLAGSAVTLYLIPWLRSKTSAETQKRIAAFVSVAVYAAEQLYGGGKGDEKLRYATKWLQDRGIQVDMESLRALIESEVYKMQHQLKPMAVEGTEAQT